MVYRIIVICVVTGMLWAGNSARAEFQRWSENVFAFIKQEYGAEAEKRLRYLENFIVENQDKPDMEKVVDANRVLNNLPWIADSSHWKSADYWATPLETITTFGGDCEDIALVKWVVLRNLGIPAEQLRLGYVKIKKSGENHMVLLFIAKPDAPAGQKEVYVLDNYVEEVLLGSERTDLLAVLALGAGGQVVLFNDDGKNRSVKGVYEDRKVKKLDDLVQRVAETRKKFEEINEGRPLMPPG